MTAPGAPTPSADSAEAGPVAVAGTGTAVDPPETGADPLGATAGTTAERERASEEKLHADLIDGLLARVEFELPEGLVDLEARRTIMQQQMQLVRLGMDPESVLTMTKDQEISEQVKENVAKELRCQMVLEKIAEAESLEVDEAELHGEVHKMATAAGRPVGVVHREMTESGAFEQLRERLRRQKVLDLIVSKADISNA